MTDTTATLTAQVIQLQRAITQALDGLREARTLADAVLAERDRYKQALREIHDHATDCYDGPEDTVHGRYLEMSGVGLGLIP